MYPIQHATNAARTRNEGLRTYSRLEYATPDGTWLLVAAGAIPRRRKPTRRSLVAWLRQVAGSAVPASDGVVAEG